MMRNIVCFGVLAAAVFNLSLFAADPAQEGGEGKMDCTLYTKPYVASEHGAYTLPAGLTWKVMPRYVGRMPNGQSVVDDRLTLVLADSKNRFWPMIAKMSIDEAESLQRELAKVILAKRSSETPQP